MTAPRPARPFIGPWESIDLLWGAIESGPPDDRPPSQGANEADVRWATAVRILENEASLENIEVYGTPSSGGSHEAISANVFISGGIDPVTAGGDGVVRVGPDPIAGRDENTRKIRGGSKQWEGLRFRIDEIERLVSRLKGEQSLTPPDISARSKGGRVPKFDRGLQEFVDRLIFEIRDGNNRVTLSELTMWLEMNAPEGEGYDPEPPIPDCGDIEFYDDKVWWKDRKGSPKSLTRRSLEPYIRRSNERASVKAT